MHIEEDELFI